MTSSEYRNTIMWTLSTQTPNGEDILTTARRLFNNLGVAFPQGTLVEVLNVLGTKDYMGWTECSAEQARFCANNGYTAMGIKGEIIVIVLPDSDKIIIDTAVPVVNNPIARALSSISEAEIFNMRFFAYAALLNPEPVKITSPEAEPAMAVMSVSRALTTCESCDSCEGCDYCDSCQTCNSCEGCESACEWGCQTCDSCQGCDSCESACEWSCQDACESSCQTCNYCESGCQVYCQTCDSCQSICQSVCQDSGQVTCEYCDSCQHCNTCQSTCESACQTVCQISCEDSCQSSCQGCESACQNLCQSCNTCQITCESVCQDTCQVSCQNGCQMCEDICQTACQDSCEVSCQTLCQSCEAFCQSVCQSTCMISCQICEDDGIHPNPPNPGTDVDSSTSDGVHTDPENPGADAESSSSSTTVGSTTTKPIYPSVYIIEPSASRTEQLKDNHKIVIEAEGENCSNIKVFVNGTCMYTVGGNYLAYSYPVDVAGKYTICAVGTSRTGHTASSASRTITIVEKTYTVTYDLNGGMGITPEKQTIPIGENVTLASLEHPRDCYKLDHIFEGWNTAADGSGALYFQGKTTSFDSNITLYAQFAYAADN